MHDAIASHPREVTAWGIRSRQYQRKLDALAAVMVRFPGMEHDEPYMAHVSPGKTAEIVWLFNRPGEFDFACLIAGHYQAGMVGRIVVNP